MLVRTFAVSRYARLPDPVGLARAGQRVIVVPGAHTSGVPITDFRHTRRFLTEGHGRSQRFLREMGIAIGTAGPCRRALSTVS